jgi:phosphate transport system permease protein
MIFIFAFREAAPIFFQPEAGTRAVQAPIEEQETYGEEMVAKGPDGAVPGTVGGAVERAEDETVTFSNLLGTVWQPVSSIPKFGMLPLVVGSFKVTLIAILLAAPIGILAALFTASFAPRWSREILKPAIEILAGFPSVVIGFFGLVTLATFLQTTFGYTYRLNAFVGGVAMSLAVIPIIYTVTEDALNAVPKYLTEASLALGATRWETALFVTLPAATPGVFAAVVLGFGRAFGETMIVLMVTGNAALLSPGIFEPVRTMSATIGSEMAEVVFGETHYTVLFLIGAILFLFTFILNAFAEIFVRKRLLRRFGGA